MKEEKGKMERGEVPARNFGNSWNKIIKARAGRKPEIRPYTTGFQLITALSQWKPKR
jgi:hypothetical protein